MYKFIEDHRKLLKERAKLLRIYRRCEETQDYCSEEELIRIAELFPHAAVMIHLELLLKKGIRWLKAEFWK